MLGIIFGIIFALHTILSVAIDAGGSHFNGTDSIITVTQQASINTSAFTAGCYVRRAGDGETAGGRILYKHGAWDLRWFTPDYRINLTGWSDTVGQFNITAPALDVWAHLAISYDGSSPANDPVMYLDGVSQSVTEVQPPAGSYAAGAGNLYIGNTDDSTRTWDGQLAECFLYDRVLAAQEVKSIYARGPTAVPRGRILYAPLGVFGARNYTSTPGLDGTPANVTLSTVPGPPLSYGSQSQGDTP